MDRHWVVYRFISMSDDCGLDKHKYEVRLPFQTSDEHIKKALKICLGVEESNITGMAHLEEGHYIVSLETGYYYNHAVMAFRYECYDSYFPKNLRKIE